MTNPASQSPEAKAEIRDQLAGWLEDVAANRDKAAFASLFEYFAPRVKGFLINKGADNALAEEIVQDVMLTVWRKADMFDRTQASASTWLFIVARNRHIDYIRRARKPGLDPEEPTLMPSGEVAPDEAFVLQQREERLHEALKILPPEQMELLRQAFFVGKSHREIADDTGIPLGTIKSRIRLAFMALRKALEDEV